MIKIEIEFFTIGRNVLDRLNVVLGKVESLKISESHCTRINIF